MRPNFKNACVENYKTLASISPSVTENNRRLFRKSHPRPRCKTSIPIYCKNRVCCILRIECKHRDTHRRGRCLPGTPAATRRVSPGPLPGLSPRWGDRRRKRAMTRCVLWLVCALTCLFIKPISLLFPLYYRPPYSLDSVHPRYDFISGSRA